MFRQGTDGHTYVSPAGVRTQAGYADVRAGTLRTWAHEGKLKVVTRGELALAFGYPPPAVGADQPAQVDGPGGKENVYRWADVVRVETKTRLERRVRGGRPRAVACPA